MKWAKFVFAAVLVIAFLLLLCMDIDAAELDPGVVVTPTPVPPVVLVVPLGTVEEVPAHPCGHRRGTSVGDACGDHTCGRLDDAKYCGGAEGCHFCCCGCEGGCGDGSEDVCVLVTDPRDRNHCR
jgi:hypothetical protein